MHRPTASGQPIGGPTFYSRAEHSGRKEMGQEYSIAIKTDVDDRNKMQNSGYIKGHRDLRLMTSLV